MWRKRLKPSGERLRNCTAGNNTGMLILLNEEEKNEMRKHPRLGYDALAAQGGYPPEMLDVVLSAMLGAYRHARARHAGRPA